MDLLDNIGYSAALHNVHMTETDFVDIIFDR